jgi:hypothetical protein
MDDTTYLKFYFPYALFTNHRNLTVTGRDIYVSLKYFMSPNTRSVYDDTRPIKHSLWDCEPILSPHNENDIRGMINMSDKITCTLHAPSSFPNKDEMTGN